MTDAEAAEAKLAALEHRIVAPGAVDLRWTCTGCDWSASDVFATPFDRGRSWERRHGELRAEVERLREDADHTSCVESYTALLARLDAGDRPSGRERLRAVNAAVAADKAEPETMTVRAFLFRYKRGSIFPAAALTEAIEALPEEMRAERRTWEQWQDEFEPMGLERKPDPGRATEGRFEVTHPDTGGER